MDAASDRRLWELSAAGDGDAFGSLFERHANAVYTFCFRRTASWVEAEDAMADVFLVAWRRRGEVELADDSASVLPWLYAVALNVLRNRRRSAHRAARALARVDRSSSVDDFADDVLGRLADERTMRDILGVVESLPEHEQDVLAVCAWAGVGYEEGAIALGVPVGTVRSRLSRARAHLRELVEASGHRGRNGKVRADDQR